MPSSARHGCGAEAGPDAMRTSELLDKVGVSAPDDKTVVVKLTKPATYFADVMALWIAVPVQEKWITSPNATEAANYVSSGPFILSDVGSQQPDRPQAEPELVRATKPTLTEIDMSMTTEPAQGQAAYEAGELDMVLTPSEDIQRVKADPTLGPQVVDIPQLSHHLLHLQQRHRPQDPQAVRSARPQGLPDDEQGLPDRADPGDRQEGLHRRDLRRPRPDPANSFVMPGIPGYQEDLDPYPFDLDVGQGAHDDGPGRPSASPSAADLGKLKFGFNSGAGHEPRVAFLAEAWRQAFGLETEQIGSDFSVFLQQRTAGEYDLARDGWGADYPHANNQLGLFVCGGGNNDVQYCNPDFDALIAQAAGEPDQDKQVGALQAGADDPDGRRGDACRFASRVLDLRGPAVRRWPDDRPRPTRSCRATCSTRPSQIKKH